MSGPCKYHSHGTYKASHSTRKCTLNDQLAKEKNSKASDVVNADDSSPPPPAARSGSQARGSGGGNQKTFRKDVRQVNMIFRGLESKRAQK